MNYAIRITRTYSEIESFVKGLNDTPYIVVYEHHDGARPHCHMLFKNCPVKTTTLKARLVRIVGDVVKTDWSFPTTYKNKEGIKVPVDDGVITYMHKGINTPVYIKGFTQEHIKEYEDKWVVMATDPRDPHPKTNKITYNDLVKEIISEMTEQDDEFKLKNGRLRTTVTFHAVPLLVMDKLRKYEIVCGRYKTRDLVDTVCNRYLFPEYRDSIVAMCSFVTK